MEFKFYINDIEVDEPVGFDATKIKLKRSENWHGVMSESADETVEFYGQGFDILSGIYAISGIDAVAVLRIEYYCSGILEESIEYNVTFYEYKEFCGNECYCIVGIEKSGCYYQLVNALDTKVNLNTTKAIDNTTELAEYEYLGKEIEVPSKTIIITDSGNLTEDLHQDWMTTSGISGNTWIVPTGATEFFVYFPLEIKLDEMDSFEPNANIKWWVNPDAGGNSGDEEFLFINEFGGQLCGNNNEFRIQAKVKANIYSDVSSLAGDPTIKVVIFKKKVDNSYVSIYTSTDLSVNVGNVHSASIDLDIDTTFTLDLGEKLEYAIRYDFTGTGGTVFNTLYADIFKECTFLMTNNSLCDATNSKMYLPHETLSRISEYVTNNCLTVYSDYLGRIDSQPYNYSEDGCGALYGLTTGLFLRRIEDVKTGDQSPIFSLSFNDVINALNAVNPLGFSIETIGENEVIRVEDWKYFYNDNIIADLGTVSVEKEPNLKLHFKNFKTGYAKYEAEEYNGLDEFLTEREYTTKLINHNGKLERVCQFVASGYAIEITRRKGNADSKDWRFDNDTFIICLRRYYGGLEVEQGNILDAENIIDPPTILNFRISPARMAMQWFQYITTFIKGAKELIFSTGKGNVSAKGEMFSDCVLETQPISENQNLTQPCFIESQNGIYTAELHAIKSVPFTFKQYKALKANPNGLFAYKCDEIQRYGWVQECSYSFVEGTIDLILIPKAA